MQDLKLHTYPVFPNPLFLRGTWAWRYGSRRDEVHSVRPSWELWAGTAPAVLVTGGQVSPEAAAGMDGCCLTQATEHGVALCDDVLAASPANSSSVNRGQKIFSVSDSMAV